MSFLNAQYARAKRSQNFDTLSQATITNSAQSGTKPNQNVRKNKKISTADRNWTCQVNEDKSEQKFYCRQEKNLFRNSRHSLTNEHVKLADGWLSPIVDLLPKHYKPTKTSQMIVTSINSENSKGYPIGRIICISNLPMSTTKPVIQQMVQSFGRIAKIRLSSPNGPVGEGRTAFVTFKRREDAAKAIQLNGYAYEKLILNVDWDRR